MEGRGEGVGGSGGIVSGEWVVLGVPDGWFVLVGFQSAEGVKMFRCSWQEAEVNVLLSGQPSPTAWGAFVELMELIGVEAEEAGKATELVSAWANCAEHLAGGDSTAWERVTPDMDFESGILILERVGV